MITWMLVGLWHGAMWTFVVWGALQGLFLCVHRLMLKGRRPTTEFNYTTLAGLSGYVLKVVGTHILFLFGLIFFRSQSFGNAWYILKKFVFWEPGQFTSHVIMIISSYYIITVGLDLIEYWTKDHTFLVRVNPAYRTGVYAATFCVTLVYMYQAPVYPFVYFQF
jgi:D-alanyl-lipoteichoic acid acyltransferase DltB (MBOAT superfamily)